MATVVGALDIVTSILNDSTYLTDPHPTRASSINWWHDTIPDPKLTFPRGYVHLVDHRIEKISIGATYCSKHTLIIGCRLFTKGDGKLATAFTEASITYKSDRFLLLYLQKVDDALSVAQQPELFPSGYKGYKGVRITEPLLWNPTQGWTAELQVQLQFYRAMG